MDPELDLPVVGTLFAPQETLTFLSLSDCSPLCLISRTADPSGTRRSTGSRGRNPSVGDLSWVCRVLVLKARTAELWRDGQILLSWSRGSEAGPTVGEGDRVHIPSALLALIVGDPVPTAPGITREKLATGLWSAGVLLRRILVEGPAPAVALDELLPLCGPDVTGDYEETSLPDLFALLLVAVAVLKDLPRPDLEACLASCWPAPSSEPVRFLQTLVRCDAEGGFGVLVQWIRRCMDELLNRACAMDPPPLGSRDPWCWRDFHFLFGQVLAQWDKALKKRRGIYATPYPVASYMVRSVRALLHRHWETDPATLPTWIDPAMGSGTFLSAVMDRETSAENDSGSAPATEVGPGLLVGIELVPVTFLVAHLALSCQWTVTYGERGERGPALHLHLGNALSLLARPDVLTDSGLPPASPVAVIGNPPYSAVSQNMDPVSRALIQEYSEISGVPLGEHKHWLHDDYVKFIRVCQLLIRHRGQGVVALVTPHSFLDGTTYRGMRHSLMQTYDHIYVLDLHGNSNKREQNAAHPRDQNVFPIVQGVSVSLCVRSRKDPQQPGRVHRADLWGRRGSVGDGSAGESSGKLEWLSSHDQNSTAWTTLDPTTPGGVWVAGDLDVASEYASFLSLAEIMPEHVTGVVTARDKLVIHPGKEQLLHNIRLLLDPTIGEEELRSRFRISENYGWTLERARQVLLADLGRDPSDRRLEGYLRPILYRPFDVRWIFYHPALIWRMRSRLMDSMLNLSNLALITRRQAPRAQPSTYFAVTRHMISDGVIRSDNHGGESLFPLWIAPRSPYGANPAQEQLWKEEPRLNLSPRFLASLPGGEGDSRGTVRAPGGPGQGASPIHPAFCYLTALCHSPGYRSRYHSHLVSDYPRFPVPATAEAYRILALLGRSVIEVYLQGEGGTLDGDPEQPDSQEGTGLSTCTLEAASGAWTGAQAGTGLPQDVADFRIGAYQAAVKWAQSRQGENCEGFRQRRGPQVVEAILRILALMEQIEAAIEEAGGWPGAFSLPVGREP